MVENLFVFISALIQGLNSIDYDVSAGVPDLWGPLAVPAKREDVLAGLQGGGDQQSINWWGIFTA